MLESLKKKQNSAVMVKHFILMNMLFPIYSTSVASVYSPDIVYANLFAVMFVGLSWLEGNFCRNRKSLLAAVLAVCLAGFNGFAFYVNKTYYGWYAGQVNVTVAFVFFLAWLLMKEDAPCMGEDLVKFFLGAAAVTNAIGLIPGLLGHQAVWISLDGYTLGIKDTGLYSWIYNHKSEYSFMLVLYLALTVVYRRLFEKKWQFWGCIAVYAMGLWIADTRATLAAVLCIPAGLLMDRLMKKGKGFRVRYLLWFLPVIAVGVLLLYRFSKERDIWSLGYRTYIWKAAVAHILDNPWGIGAMCGLQSFPAEGLNFEVWNCHNVFLNYFLQFSIPAGAFYLAMMAAIVLEAVRKNLSFQTLGIWAALLIPMNMDWCLLLPQVPLMLLAVYFMFFHPLAKKTGE